MNVSESRCSSSSLAAMIAATTFAFASCSSVEHRGVARGDQSASNDSIVSAPLPIDLGESTETIDLGESTETTDIASTRASFASDIRTTRDIDLASPLRVVQDRDRTNQPWEVTLGGAGSNNEDFDAGGAQAAIGVGYYFSEMMLLSFKQNGSYADLGEGVPAAWNGISRVALDLHFPIEEFVPYVGANFGYAYGDSVNETLLAGPQAGLKVYVKDDVFVQFGVEYEFFFDDDDSLNDAFDDGQFIYGLNFGVRF